MVKKLLYVVCSASLLVSCSDVLDELEPSMNFPQSRAVSAITSPTFDWESLPSISLINVNGGVILPWYSGAIANIPSYILKDYTVADGWKMVYNTCSPSANAQDDKYYLLFYNIFSGRLRGFVYNKNNVTAGSDTYWQFTFNEGTALLNDISDLTLPANEITENREMLVSNMTNTPTKALTRGWNAFDADFLVYDPSAASKNITFSLSAFDVKYEDLIINGEANSQSVGTMVTTTNVTTLKTPEALNKGVSYLADKAQDEFKKIFDENTNSRGLLSSAVGSIIKAGGNFLVKKFFGRNSTSTTTSTSDIKIQTTSTIKLKGTITSQQQSNISPISQLMLPGTTPTPQDIFLPSYNELLGVWSLSDAPKVTATSYDWMYPILKPSIDVNAVIKPQKTSGNMGKRTVYVLSDCPVQLNPAVESCIEKYDVSKQLVYVKEHIGNKPNQVMKVPNSQYGETYNKMLPSYEFYSKQDSLYVLSSSTSFDRIVIQNLESGIVEMNNNEAFPYLNTGVQRNDIWWTDKNDIYVKVTVTLYPKAPYNTTPIVSTRTFKPVFVENK